MSWLQTTISIGLGTAVLVSVSLPLSAADIYAFDKGHTEIIFKWNHVGLSTQSGEFRDFDGTVSFDRENLANSSVEVTIKAASIDTGVKDLDDHLKSADFFEVETYPDITFKSTSVKQTGVDRGEVTGDLTIHGVTKSVSLDVKLQFEGDHPLGPFIEAYAGAPYVAFSGRTEILRSDFGVGAFAPLTSDHVEIVIETEMRQQN